MNNTIRNERAFVQSALYNGSLWKYPSGSIMGTDFDQIAEKRGYFLFAETKRFWNGEATIPLGQLILLRELNKQLSHRTVFLAGTDSYYATNHDDFIWYTTMDEIEERRYGQDKQLLKKEFMHKVTKKQFDALGNGLINESVIVA